MLKESTGKPSALLTTNQLTPHVPITKELCKNYNQKTDWVFKKCFILNLVAGTVIVNYFSCFALGRAHLPLTAYVFSQKIQEYWKTIDF